MEGTCGMYICKKCGGINLVFGILFLISGLFSVAMLLLSYFNSKKEQKLKIE